MIERPESDSDTLEFFLTWLHTSNMSDKTFRFMVDVVVKAGTAIILHNEAMKRNDSQVLRVSRLMFAPLWLPMGKTTYFKIVLMDEEQTNRLHPHILKVRKTIDCTSINALGEYQARDARQEELIRDVLSLTNHHPTGNQWLGACRLYSDLKQLRSDLSADFGLLSKRETKRKKLDCSLDIQAWRERLRNSNFLLPINGRPLMSITGAAFDGMDPRVDIYENGSKIVERACASLIDKGNTCWKGLLTKLRKTKKTTRKRLPDETQVTESTQGDGFRIMEILHAPIDETTQEIPAQIKETSQLSANNIDSQTWDEPNDGLAVVIHRDSFVEGESQEQDFKEPTVESCFFVSTAAEQTYHEIMDNPIHDEQIPLLHRCVRIAGLQCLRISDETTAAWISGDIIVAYLELLQNHCSSHHSIRRQFFYFDPSWFAMFDEKPDKVLNWSWITHIFDVPVVYLPIHYSNFHTKVHNHWSLIIIDVQNSVITYFDSLKDCQRAQTVLSVVLKFVKGVESMVEKEHGSAKNRLWKAKDECTPQQATTVDCGIFVLGMIKLHAMGLDPLDFSQSLVSHARKRLLFELRCSKIEI